MHKILLVTTALVASSVAFQAKAYEVTYDENNDPTPIDLNKQLESYTSDNTTSIGWLWNLTGKEANLTTQNIVFSGNGSLIYETQSSILNLGNMDAKTFTAKSSGAHVMFIIDNAVLNLQADEISLTSQTKNISTPIIYVKGTGDGTGKSHKVSEPFLNILGKNINISSTGTGVEALEYAHITLGNENTENVSITAAERAVHAGNNSTLATADMASVDITAKNISIEATGTGENAYAVGAMSQGVVNIHGNASITAENALLARGSSVININTTDSDADNVTQINGNIDFNFFEPNSNTGIDSYVNLVLSGENSSWTGNTHTSYTYYAEGGKYSGLDDATLRNKLSLENSPNLTLQNGAVWNATEIGETSGTGKYAISGSGTEEDPYIYRDTITGSYYTALNELIIKGDKDINGTVNIADTKNGVAVNNADVKNAVFTGGMLNVNEKLNVSGDLTLDSGISGKGSVVFDKDATLNVKTNVTTIANEVTTNAAKLNLIFDNAFTGEYQLITDEGKITDQDFTIVDNNIYDIKGLTDKLGTYSISAKSAEDMAQTIGADENQAAAVAAMTSAKAKDNDTFNTVADSIASLLQADETKDKGLDAVSTMSAEAAPIVSSASRTHVNQIFGAVSTRLSGGAVASPRGRASGDVLDNSAVWVQGLLNQSKLDDAFNTHTGGVAFGAEKEILTNVKAGLAYAFAKSDIDSATRDTEVKSHTAVAYGEYKPNNWFVNGMAAYTWSRYEEEKSVLGTDAHAKYDADTISVQATTGYDFDLSGYTLTPTLGMRYVNIDQEAYKDALGTRVSSDNMDILTAMLGLKVAKDYMIDQIVLTPEARFGVTYDITRSDDNALVTLANGAAYRVQNENLKRMAYEVGAGVTAAIDDRIDFTVSYDGSFRKDYQDHTGLFTVKYHF